MPQTYLIYFICISYCILNIRMHFCALNRVRFQSNTTLERYFLNKISILNCEKFNINKVIIIAFVSKIFIITLPYSPGGGRVLVVQWIRRWSLSFEVGRSGVRIRSLSSWLSWWIINSLTTLHWSPWSPHCWLDELKKKEEIIVFFYYEMTRYFWAKFIWNIFEEYVLFNEFDTFYRTL